MKLYIILGILAVIIIWFICTLNKFIYLRRRIDRSKSLIDVYLKNRFDLIPNLVECCKGYSNYEKNTLTEIDKLRSSYEKNNDEESGEKLNNHYKKLVALIENYPELKAGENFLNLQKNLEKVESEIAASRRIYINDITRYNTLTKSIPANIIAKIFNYEELSYPILETEEIKINF